PVRPGETGRMSPTGGTSLSAAARRRRWCVAGVDNHEGGAMDVLKGIRVIDLTMWAFVPSAGGVLAHWGADVIKVEGPRAPDPMRLLGGSLEPGDQSFYFKHYSRGKRAIALDLATDEGREALYRLVDTADVFLT